ncbi:MAG: zinc permease [Cyclobacteriaceae bacterium]|nr:zinc permease [Cyclobacteriaceae bacterium SS2]
MTIVILVLLSTTILGGLATLLIGLKPTSIRLPLIFAGSFLFGVTIIHILPEIFTLSDQPMSIGVFILIGFFFQQLLEHYTSGIEHGHFHAHKSGGSTFSGISLLVALVIHSLMEGALLTHDSPFHARHESHTLLLGIILHKMPAAFALMTTVKTGSRFTVGQWFILIIFAISSPLGLIFSEYVLALSHEYLLYLFALVSGGFLHISTTIFVESSPEHKIGFKKIIAAVGGATVAIVAEFFL